MTAEEFHPTTCDGPCRDQEELFFPDARGRGAARAAIAVCFNDCRADTRVECLVYALRIKAEFGVWGGTAAIDRKRALKHYPELPVLLDEVRAYGGLPPRYG